MAKHRSTVVHLSSSDAPRDNYYLGICDCGDVWFFGRAPMKAQKETKSHARRAPGHIARIIDVSALREVARYQFEVLRTTDETDDPPY